MSKEEGQAAQPRQGMMSMSVSSKSALYASYMSFLRNGGLFIPTSRQYGLGDEVFMMLQLMDDPTRYPLAGKVVWITPSGAQGGKAQGVGIHFGDDDAARTLRARIEQILGAHLRSTRPTHTL